MIIHNQVIDHINRFFIILNSVLEIHQNIVLSQTELTKFQINLEIPTKEFADLLSK